uniref:Nose resistant to fluoxetine protein 6-like n=1 Tax=Diabrotica virgifera virgifera TaxID=50390 RepID=A0A6P7GNQ6_DIAVI
YFVFSRRVLETDYFQQHYIAPHTRAPPYILGLALGFTLYRIKNQNLKFNTAVLVVGWITAAFCICSVVLVAHFFHVENYQHNRLFSSLFLACSRSIWSFGLIWIIICCQIGQGGIVNNILSNPVFKVLGRLSYCIFLLHYGFQAAMQASRKTPQYFSNFFMVYNTCADIFLMTALAVPFSLCFEYPFLRLIAIVSQSSGQRAKLIKVTPEKS